MYGCLRAVLLLRQILQNNRVISFIDGFNLYHAIDDLNKNNLKWVNLWGLSSAFITPSTDTLENVYYFTAYATWLPDRHLRHREYVKALNHYGVTTVLGHFKEKDMKCNNCSRIWTTHEEKESDVNIAIHLLNEAHLDNFDKAIVITADSDLVPAIEMVKMNFPNKEIIVATPPNRYRIAREIQSLVTTRKIKEKHLSNNLLPEIKHDLDNNIIFERPMNYQ